MVLDHDVQPPTRKPAPGREVPDAPGVRGVPRARDPQADPEPDQSRASQQVGAQDEVAERGIAGHQFPEPADRHREHLARVEGHRGIVGAPAGQQAELAEEPAAAVDGDDALLWRSVPFDRGHPSGQDDKEVAVPVAFTEQDLFRSGLMASALRGQRGDLRVAESRIRPLQIGGLRDVLARLADPGRIGPADSPP